MAEFNSSAQDQAETIAPLTQTTSYSAEPEASDPRAALGTQSISWTASEFIAHEKSASWYLSLGGVAVVVATLIWLITRDLVSSGVVLFGALMLGIYGARKPRQLPYRVDSYGVQIGPKYYSYQSFRSFSVVAEGAFSSIMFMPLKRFSPALSIYYDPNDEVAILNLVALQLPHEQRNQDLIDRLMHSIRF